MPYVASIGTYLPCWGTPQHRVAGDDEDAAKQAFSMAGMTPVDIDVAEVHDFFTGIELISYEDLGFAERFGAYKLLEAEVTTIGLAHNIGGPTAVSAVTILEGPGTDG